LAHLPLAQWPPKPRLVPEQKRNEDHQNRDNENERAARRTSIETRKSKTENRLAQRHPLRIREVRSQKSESKLEIRKSLRATSPSAPALQSIARSSGTSIPSLEIPA